MLSPFLSIGRKTASAANNCPAHAHYGYAQFGSPEFQIIKVYFSNDEKLLNSAFANYLRQNIALLTTENHISLLQQSFMPLLTQTE